MNPSFSDLYDLWAKDNYGSFLQYMVVGKEDWRGLTSLRCSTCRDDLPIVINNREQSVRVGGREWRWQDPAFTFDSFRPFIEAHIWNHGWKGGLLNAKNDPLMQEFEKLPE